MGAFQSQDPGGRLVAPRGDDGPFHRRFLDGYFPLRVCMDVQFPSTLLHYVGISPVAQPGFEVDVKDEHVYIDSWFAGTLNIEVHFSEGSRSN